MDQRGLARKIFNGEPLTKEKTMKSLKRLFLAVLLVFSGSGLIWGQENITPNFETRNASIMRPDLDTLKEWIRRYREAPKAFIDEGIQENLQRLEAGNIGTSKSLLSHISYIPAERNQGLCGNCWNWAGTGVLEIAHHVQNGVFERLSTQFLNSCKLDEYACCGGDLEMFADWYRQRGIAIPWSNTNAGFAEGGRDCLFGRVR